MNQIAESVEQPSTHVAKGMPPLDMSGPQVSFFEFWPTWLIYLPVVVQSVVLAIWHRSLTLPLIANPKLPLSGMVGMGKSTIFAQATGSCDDAILDWFLYRKDERELSEQVVTIEKKMSECELSYPVVAKPDVGCRGVGVKLVHDREELMYALSHYPHSAGMLLQKLATWEPEAGVFYVREPNEAQGRIISLALKYSPYVVGDGKQTLRELIESDTRAGMLAHLYLERHKPMLDQVLNRGETFRLVFSASHCRGAIFRDGNVYISSQLESKIDQLMKGLPDFYYGRLDIKFKDLDSLQRGENIEIVEINSASSEPLHIWDRKTSLRSAMSALLFQYRALFKLGAQNRSRGFRPPKFGDLMRAWRAESRLTQLYPETD